MSRRAARPAAALAAAAVSAALLALALATVAASAETPLPAGPVAGAALPPYAGAAPFRWEYPDTIAAVMTDLIGQAETIAAPIYAELGLTMVRGVVVRVARDHADFLKLAPPGDAFPEWSQGITIPPRGEIYLTVFDARGAATDLGRTFAHEVSHVAVHVASGGKPVPRWFVEGYAILQSGEFSMDQVETMAQLVARGGVSLRRMDRAFHDHAPSASAAYGAAADFVRFYRDACGRPALARVVAAVRDGADFYEAMGRLCHAGAAAGAPVPGESFDALEARWAAGLRERYPWWMVFRDDGLLFAAGGVLVVLAFLAVRRRRRVSLAAMESDERRFDAATDRAVAAAEQAERRLANAALRRARGLRDPLPPPAPPAPSRPAPPPDEDESPPPGGWLH
jgi:cytochrome c5